MDHGCHYLLFSDGSEFSRGRKKAPDVAYKCHEFFEARGGARGDMDHVDSRVTRVSHVSRVTSYVLVYLV